MFAEAHITTDAVSCVLLLFVVGGRAVAKTKESRPNVE